MEPKEQQLGCRTEEGKRSADQLKLPVRPA
jgi:hypothetical protein